MPEIVSGLVRDISPTLGHSIEVDGDSEKEIYNILIGLESSVLKEFKTYYVPPHISHYHPGANELIEIGAIYLDIIAKPIKWRATNSLENIAQSILRVRKEFKWLEL